MLFVINFIYEYINDIIYILFNLHYININKIKKNFYNINQ